MTSLNTEVPVSESFKRGINIDIVNHAHPPHGKSDPSWVSRSGIATEVENLMVLKF